MAEKNSTFVTNDRLNEYLDKRMCNVTEEFRLIVRELLDRRNHAGSPVAYRYRYNGRHLASLGCGEMVSSWKYCDEVELINPDERYEHQALFLNNPLTLIPIYQVNEFGRWYETEKYLYEEAISRDDLCRTVYAAIDISKINVIPDEKPPAEFMAKGRSIDASYRRQGFEAGWQAYRAEILKLFGNSEQVNHSEGSLDMVKPKDHVFREMVNSLREVAKKYHSTQQLREQIAHVFFDAIPQLFADNVKVSHIGDDNDMVNDPVIPVSCTWNYIEDDYSWVASCGHSWIFNEGDPEENSVKFCHCCGKPVLVVEPEGDES